MRTRAKFVYLFKKFQCLLSYHSSSLGRGNINGLRFHLLQEYLFVLAIKLLVLGMSKEYGAYSTPFCSELCCLLATGVDSTQSVPLASAPFEKQLTKLHSCS